MLHIIYSDNKISSSTYSVYPIQTDKDEIQVSGLIPVDSYVTARIEMDNGSIMIPLGFSKIVDLDSKVAIFKNKLYLTDYDISKLSKAKTISLRIYINQVIIPGEVPMTFNSKSIARTKTKNESAVLDLAKEVTSLKARLDAYMNKNFKFDYTNEVVKGMVPVAVDNMGNYKWDFPFNATEQLVIQLSQNVVSQAELIKTLTDRVANLEQQIIDHITETLYI
jgi:hypothetical protein